MSINKKIIFGFISIICALLCVISVLSYFLWAQKNMEAPMDVVIDTSQETTQMQYGVLNNTEIARIDKEYETELDTAHSNIEVCEVNKKYTDIWKEYMEECYQKCLSATQDDVAQKNLITSQKQWEIYMQNCIIFEDICLKKGFQGGTITPIISTDYKRNIYRQRAVELNCWYDMIVTPLLPEQES